ncbi:MAG TPA: DUF459 domain-containing protein [Actinomycetota bacterium]|nr:DUF459 domain-containing protein [Actinomycetota bacterium]
MVVCLALWTVLAAPNLERGAEGGPIGARRTAALVLLRPIAVLSRFLSLSEATGSVEHALGRDPDAPAGGELVLPELDLPRASLSPVDPAPPAAEEDEPAPTGTVGEPASQGHPEPPAEEENTDPTGIRTPTYSNRLRVAVIGDSLSQGLGPAIEQWFDPEFARVLSLGRQSTGLSRQDYFNWRSGMRQIVEEFRPDLVFVLLGSNDAQAQVSATGSPIPVGSVEWVNGYRERAEQMLSEATKAGTHVVWVGIPVVADRWRWDFYRRVNDIYRQAAATSPLATYVDSWAAFEAKDGGYTAFVRNERGELQEMRAPDGIHFTPTGYAYLGRIAIRSAAASFDLPEKSVTFSL